MQLDFAGVLINWFPMLLLIGVWIYFLRRSGAGGYRSGFQKDYLEEMRKQTAALERIAAGLDKPNA